MPRRGTQQPKGRAGGCFIGTERFFDSFAPADENYDAIRDARRCINHTDGCRARCPQGAEWNWLWKCDRCVEAFVPEAPLAPVTFPVWRRGGVVADEPTREPVNTISRAAANRRRHQPAAGAGANAAAPSAWNSGRLMQQLRTDATNDEIIDNRVVAENDRINAKNAAVALVDDNATPAVVDNRLAHRDNRTTTTTTTTTTAAPAQAVQEEDEEEQVAETHVEFIEE